MKVELPHDFKVSMDYFEEIEEYRSVGDEYPEAKILKSNAARVQWELRNAPKIYARRRLLRV